MASITLNMEQVAGLLKELIAYISVDGWRDTIEIFEMGEEIHAVFENPFYEDVIVVRKDGSIEVKTNRYADVGNETTD